MNKVLIAKRLCDKALYKQIVTQPAEAYMHHSPENILQIDVGRSCNDKYLKRSEKLIPIWHYVWAAKTNSIHWQLMNQSYLPPVILLHLHKMPLSRRLLQMNGIKLIVPCECCFNSKCSTQTRGDYFLEHLQCYWLYRNGVGIDWWRFNIGWVMAWCHSASLE